MLHHIVWPHGVDAPMLFTNINQRLPSYHGDPPGTEKILVFDRYDDISAKDHERIRRAGEGSKFDHQQSTTKSRRHSQE